MSYNPQNPNGQATSANSAPVVIASDQSTLPVDGNVASGATDSGNPVKAGGKFNASNPTLTDGQRGDLQLDASGNLKVNIASGNSSNAQYAEGATAATATGTLAMGKNGTTVKAAQTDASGNLRIDISQTSANATAIKIDGSAVTQPVSGTVGLASGANSVGTVGINAGANSIGTVGLNAGSNNIGGVELVDAGGTNKLSVNASGQAAVVATGGDLTSGSQTSKITDGTNTANVGLGDANNGFVYTGSGHLTQTFSLTTVGAGSSYDVGNYRWVSVQVSTVGGSGASMGFQASNDNANFINTALVSSGSTAVTATTAATASAGAGIYHGPLTGRYFRLNVTALASGSFVGTIIFSTQPGVLASYGVAVSQQSSPWVSSLQPATSGGWSISSQTALTNTVVAAKASAGQVGGHMFYNPNSSVSYIQVFNVASGSVTLGTTAPTLVIPLPAGAAANVEWANGIAFGAAISFAATTTATGNTAPTTALTGFLLYK
jgi:hypothetical protein